MGEWKTKTLGELTALMTKGIAPSYVEAESDSTVRVLNQKCNRDFNISYAESRLNDCNKKKVSAERYIQPGDVLINSTGTGTAGRVAQIWDVPCKTTIDGHMILMRPTDEMDVLYYGYAVKMHQSKIESFAEGSTGQTEINKRRLCDEIEVPFPVDIQEQHRIAAMLLSIDERITVNKQINDNLEQQAQALFRSWFVDFIPYGGILPDSWTTACLGDIAVIQTNAFSPEKNPHVMLEHYSIPAFDEQKYPVFELSNNIKSNKYIVTSNSVLISKLNPDTKRVWRPMCISDRAVCSTEFIVFEAKKTMQKDFVYSVIDSTAFSDWMCAHTTGSTNSRQRTTPGTTLNFQIPIPDEATLNDFCAVVSPMYDMISANIIENRKLAIIRDKLLPKLMSGEIDILSVEV